MGGGTGSLATHVLLRCAVALRRGAACAMTHPPSQTLLVGPLGGCVSSGGEAREREIRWRGFNPHHLSREDKNNKALEAPRGLVGAIGHFGTKNAREVKRRILLTSPLFVSQLPTSVDRRQQVATQEGGVAPGVPGCCVGAGGHPWASVVGRALPKTFLRKCLVVAILQESGKGTAVSHLEIAWSITLNPSLLLLCSIVATSVPEGL